MLADREAVCISGVYAGSRKRKYEARILYRAKLVFKHKGDRKPFFPSFVYLINYLFYVDVDIG